MSMSSGMPVLTRSSSLENRPDRTRLVFRLTSTVLSMRRVRSAGMRKPWSRTAFDEVEARHLGHHLQLDQAVTHDLRREPEPDTELPELNGYTPIGHPDRHCRPAQPGSASRHRRGTSPARGSPS